MKFNGKVVLTVKVGWLVDFDAPKKPTKAQLLKILQDDDQNDVLDEYLIDIISVDEMDLEEEK